MVKDQFVQATSRVLTGWEHLVDPQAKTPCRSLMIKDGGLWNMGSQGMDLSFTAWPFIAAHYMTGDPRYLAALQDGVAFIYGANPLSMSFVAQVGKRWPGTVFNQDSYQMGARPRSGSGRMATPSWDYLLFADYRNAVFRLAGDHAGVTSHAGCLIDGHSPGVAFVLESRIYGQLFGRLGGLFHKGWILPILVDVSGDHDSAPFHRMMVLGDSQGELTADFTNSTPYANEGASEVRKAYALNPTPLPTRPALVRPKPR